MMQPLHSVLENHPTLLWRTTTTSKVTIKCTNSGYAGLITLNLDIDLFRGSYTTGLSLKQRADFTTHVCHAELCCVEFVLCCVSRCSTREGVLNLLSI